ncbi:MAG: hypothetical protein ABH885_00310 [Candidatus Omnitrophota bacterium]
MNKKLLIFLIAGAIRITVISYVLVKCTAAPLVDSAEYVQIAENVVNGQGYSIVLDLKGHGIPETETGLHPTAWRVPGYPLLLAGLMRLGLPLYSVLFCQVAIDLFSLALLLCLPVPPRIRYVAALLYALSPQNILFSSIIMAETWLTFFMLLGIYFVSRILSGKNTAGAAVLSGMAFAAASLFHPVCLLFPAAVFLFLLVLRYRKAAGLMLIVYVICIAPWMIRNSAVFGGPVYSTNANVFALIHRVPTLYAPFNTPANIRVRGELYGAYREELEKQGKTGGNIEVNSPIALSLGARHAMAAVAEKPSRVLTAGAWSTARLLFSGHADYGILFNWPSFAYNAHKRGYAGAFKKVFANRHAWMILTLNALAAAVVCLGIVGFCLMIADKRHKALAVLMGLAVVYMLLVTFPTGQARYRTSIMPYLSVMDAFAIVFIVRKLKT